MEATWDTIVELFTSQHKVIKSKDDSMLFNAVRYKRIDEVPEYTDDWVMATYTGMSHVRRKQINILENDLFVIDYDKEVNLEEILKKFKKYEYVYYTSYRHLYDGETEKFRILFPFKKPIPSWKRFDESERKTSYGEWYQIIDSLKEFTGPCDSASFNPNTIYNMPSSPESRMHLSRSGHNEGELLDWEAFEKKPYKDNESNPSTQGNNNAELLSTEHLEPDQILQTEIGPIVVSEITGKINGVLCPFHNDKKGTEFVRKVEGTGNIFLYCRSCQKNYYMRRESFTPELNITEKAKLHARISNHDRMYTIDELLEFPEEIIYTDSSDRNRAIKQLKDIKEQINKDEGYKSSSIHPVYTDLHLRKYKSHILYMPEGSGKSQLVVDMAKEGQKIIFACKSWSQVESKYNEYLRIGIKEGFNVRIIRSKEAKSRKRFGSKTIRQQQKHPFSSSRILDEESIDEFIKNNPDLSEEYVRLCWLFFSSDRMSFEYIPHPEIYEDGTIGNDEITPPVSDNNTRIILTTFEQLRIHRLKNIDIPKDWIIWFDDPDVVDVVDIEPYGTDKWNELPEDQLHSKTKEINGRRYFKRNPQQSLGYSLKEHKCIYTTTEIITRQAIELMMRKRDEKYVAYDHMDHISGGMITVLGTSKVRKRFDGIIPLLARRLTKKKYPTILIADGLSSELNHSNNKGRNDLSKINLLVELSIPHPIQVRTICDSLELPFKENRRDITQSIMLDRLHQAIGRNSGYRWKGYQCVALVDSGVHRNIVEKTRYKIDSENSVQIDRTKTMSRMERKTSDSASPIVKEIETTLNNLDQYITDNRIVKHDINFVISSIKDNQKKLDYIVRLLVSLSQLSGVVINKEFEQSKELPLKQKGYWELMVWIMDTHVTDNERGNVVGKLRKTMKEL